MKKLFALVCTFALALACITLTGCGDKGGSDLTNSKYVGTWEATKATVADEETTVEEVLDGPFILELKGDGSCDATMGEDKIEATWSETGDGIKTKGTSDKLDLKFKDNDGTLETSVVGMHFYLEKK